ncbi:uncharacterized protein TNCV_4075261 [Trichonephila clavipes]|nr:uncharacterized protein TNCV_4075261 [Trichonephila clavipes]
MLELFGRQGAVSMLNSSGLSVNAPVFLPASFSDTSKPSENSGAVDVTSCIYDVVPDVQTFLCAVLIQFYSTVATALPSKRLNLSNMSSNKADAIPEELKSCALETIEKRHPANEWLHIYTDGSYLP